MIEIENETDFASEFEDFLMYKCLGFSFEESIKISRALVNFIETKERESNK